MPPDDHETAQLATAGEQFDEATDRLSATMVQICPDDIHWASTGGVGDVLISQVRFDQRGRGPFKVGISAQASIMATAASMVTARSGSFIFQDFVPPFDATTVVNLKAGAIILGKTQIGPLATTRPSTRTGAGSARRRPPRRVSSNQ